MLETMRAADGVGLAAQQVGHALQLTVLDTRVPDRPSAIFVDGKERAQDEFMPLKLINPVVQKVGTEQVTGTEGCLSFPETSAEILRATRVAVQAQTLEGRSLQFEATGLLARALQHEVDHLNGILFIDRMDAAVRASFSGKLKRLQKESKEQYSRRATARLAGATA
jgi:peptide deformylase